MSHWGDGRGEVNDICVCDVPREFQLNILC